MKISSPGQERQCSSKEGEGDSNVDNIVSLWGGGLYWNWFDTWAPWERYQNASVTLVPSSKWNLRWGKKIRELWVVCLDEPAEWEVPVHVSWDEWKGEIFWILSEASMRKKIYKQKIDLWKLKDCKILKTVQKWGWQRYSVGYHWKEKTEDLDESYSDNISVYLI